MKFGRLIVKGSASDTAGDSPNSVCEYACYVLEGWVPIAKDLRSIGTGAGVGDNACA